MKEATESSTLVVTNKEAAAVLGDPASLRLLAPFLGHERTLKGVATDLEVPLSTLYKRVTRFVSLGLVKITRETARNGRAIKHYRCVADAFFVPGHLVPARSADHAWPDYFHRMEKRGLEHSYLGGNGFGRRVYRDASGVFATGLAATPDRVINPLEKDAPALFNMSHDAVYLDFGDAKAFQRELHDLTRRYMEKGGAQRHLVRVTLMPLPEDVELIP